MRLKVSDVDWTRTYRHEKKDVTCKISKLKGAMLYLVEWNGQKCIYGGNFEKKLLEDPGWRLQSS